MEREVVALCNNYMHIFELKITQGLITQCNKFSLHVWSLCFMMRLSVQNMELIVISWKQLHWVNKSRNGNSRFFKKYWIFQNSLKIMVWPFEKLDARKYFLLKSFLQKTYWDGAEQRFQWVISPWVAFQGQENYVFLRIQVIWSYIFQFLDVLQTKYMNFVQ